MKIIIYSLVITLLGYILHQFTPWWSIAIIAAAVGAIASVSVYRSFIIGFLGAAILWGVLALFINIQNDGILARRVGDLLGGVTPGILILITAVIAGLVGGMGALTGALGRLVFKPTSR